MRSTYMGALADNKFNRILDNDLSESVNVIFLIIQHFSAENIWVKNAPKLKHKKFMKNIFSSIKLPEGDFRSFFYFGGGEKEFMLIKKRKHEKEENLFCLLVLVK